MTKLASRNPKQENLKVIEKKTFGNERALYASNNLCVKNVSFKGKEDGESALKESSNIIVEKCFFELRYPLWHVSSSTISQCRFTSTCRAPFWYDNNLDLIDINLDSVKAFRECKGLNIVHSVINSEEPFWNCNDIVLSNSTVSGFYAFFGSKNIEINKMKFDGKYSFQYVNNLTITNSTLNTKDAFWHAKNVVVKNSTIKGEYIGWYSKNVTLINCTIESHQGFCYCKNLKLVDCKFPNSDLAFEYSSVSGSIVGKIDSIKNLLKGKIKVDHVGQLIFKDSKYKTKGKVIAKKVGN